MDNNKNDNSLKHYEYSIKVEEGLYGNVGKYKNWIKVEIDAGFDRWIP